MEKKDLEEQARLFELVKQIAQARRMNGNLSMSDELERLVKLLSILDREWEDFNERIRVACGLMIVGGRLSYEDMRETCLTVLELEQVVVELAGCRQLIEGYHGIAEQLYLYLRKEEV